MKKTTSHNLGTFEVKSGALFVTDPCYEREVNPKNIVRKVMNGIWEAMVITSDEGSWGIRNGILIAYHEKSSPTGYVNWSRKRFEVGVDSGQAGIYDNDKFVGRIDGDDASEEWYQKNCKLSMSTLSAGVLDGGCISSSGFGDGGYVCRTNTVDGKVVGVMIDFLID